MKKSKLLFASVVIILLMLPIMGWSQFFQPGTVYHYPSTQSQASFGLFDRPYDAASSVSDLGIDTESLLQGRNWLFGGLTNFTTIPTGVPYYGVPLAMGYYHAGSVPWSVFGDVFVDSDQSGFTNGTVVFSTIDKTIGTEHHMWVDQDYNNQYDNLQSLDLEGGAQFLIGLGPLNTGLVVKASYEQDTIGADATVWADENRTYVETLYYDTEAADPNVVPAPAVNYTYTETWSDPDTEFILKAGIPFFISLGTAGLEGVLVANYSSRDLSYSYTESYTAPVNLAPGSFDGVIVEDSITNKYGYLGGELDTILTIPPFLGDHPDNRFEVGLSGGFMMYTVEDSVETYIEQDYDYVGDGSALTPANNFPPPFITDEVITYSREGTTFYGVFASAQHYFYFDLAEPVRFGLAPQVGGGIAYTPPVIYYTSQEVEVIKDDLDFDGLYDSAADEITTTTINYSNNDDGEDFDIIVSCSLPSALQFHPEGSPFGITIGNELGVDFTRTKVKDNTTTWTEQVDVVDGTGASVSSDTYTAEPSNEHTSTTTTWEFRSQFSIAFNFYLPGGATVDILLLGTEPLGRVAIEANIPLK